MSFREKDLSYTVTMYLSDRERERMYILNYKCRYYYSCYLSIDEEAECWRGLSLTWDSVLLRVSDSNSGL